MSFSVVAADEDDPVALHELFEVVDEWIESSSASPVRVDGLPAVCASSPEASGACGRTKRKRVRDPAVDVRRRLRKKEERVGLERYVVELQKELGCLRGGRSGANSTSRLSSAIDTVDSREVRRSDSQNPAAEMSATQRELVAAKAANELLKTQVARNEAVKFAMIDTITAMAVSLQRNRGPSLIACC